jgi:hypothetical protein
MQLCLLLSFSMTAIRILFVDIFDVYYVTSSEVIALLLFNKIFLGCFKSPNEQTKKSKRRAEFLFAASQLLW